MFEGFRLEHVDIGDAVLRVRHGGEGPPPRYGASSKACPTLFLWSTRDDMEELYGDPLAIWREWADDVRGMGIDSGHHIGEDAPEALAAALVEFAGATRPGPGAARPATRR